MGGSAPDKGCEPAYDIGMEGAATDLLEKGGVVDAIESFAVIYGYGCGTVGGLLLVETLGDGCCEGEECRGGGVELLETMLGGVVGQCCVEMGGDQFFEDFAGRTEEGYGPVGLGLIGGLVGFEERNDFGVLPECWDVGGIDGVVKDVAEVGDAAWGQVLQVQSCYFVGAGSCGVLEAGYCCLDVVWGERSELRVYFVGIVDFSDDFPGGGVLSMWNDGGELLVEFVGD